MGLFTTIGKLMDSDYRHLDFMLHFAVSVGIVVLQALLLNDHADGVVSNLTAASLILIAVQAVYHLGLVIQYLVNGDKDETTLGEYLRNALTAGALLFSVSAWAHLSSSLGKPESDTNRIQALWSSIGLLAMRLLDAGLDQIDGFKGTLDVVCEDPDDNRTDVAPGFNTRIISTHLLLAGSAVTGWMHYANLVDKHDSTISDGDLSIEFIGLLLVSVHFVLYPLVYGLQICGLDKYFIMVAKCGKAEDCDKLESLNRVPIVRTAVATLAIACLSFILGATLSLNDARLLIASLGLYVAADVVGRNYI